MAVLADGPNAFSESRVERWWMRVELILSLGSPSV